MNAKISNGVKFLKTILYYLFLAQIGFYKIAEGIEIPNPLGYDTFTELFAAILKWLTIISAPIVALVIIFAGFKMITSGEKQAAREEAKKTITYAIIGYAIILLSWSIVLLIKNVLIGK